MFHTTGSQIDQAQKVLQYSFTHQSYLVAALWDQETSPLDTPESQSHNRTSLAAIGESTIRTAFLLEGYSASSPGRLAHQLQNSELAAFGYVHGLDQLVDLSHSYDGGEAVVAAVVKAVLGAVFLDSSHSMLTVRAVMQALGFSFPPARKTPTNQLRMRHLESGSQTGRQATPDCFNGPDCGCGCLWLDQYSSAGWYTPTKESGKFSPSQLDRASRAHSLKKQHRLPPSAVNTSSMDRLKNWITEVEPESGTKANGNWFDNANHHFKDGTDSPEFSFGESAKEESI